MAVGKSEATRVEIELIPGTEIVRVIDEGYHDHEVYEVPPQSPESQATRITS